MSSNLEKSEKTRSLQGMVQIFFAMSLGGASVVVAKCLEGDYSPWFIGAFSSFISFFVLTPFQRKGWQTIKKLGSKEWILVGLQALFGIVLFRLFTLWGLRYASALTVGILTSFNPAVFALLAWIFLGENPRMTGLLSILLGVSGLFILNWFSVAPGGEDTLRGSGFILLALVSEGCLTLFRKKSSGRLSGNTNAWVISLVAFLFFLIPLCIEGSWPHSIPWQDFLLFLFYGGGATALAYVLWGSGAMKITQWQTGLLSISMPLSSLTLSLLLLGDRAYWYHWIGMLIGVFAMVMGCLPYAKRYISTEKKRK